MCQMLQLALGKSIRLPRAPIERPQCIVSSVRGAPTGSPHSWVGKRGDHVTTDKVNHDHGHHLHISARDMVLAPEALGRHSQLDARAGHGPRAVVLEATYLERELSVL